MTFIRRLTNPIRWAWQRLTRGWDDRVIWSIDYHLAEMMPQWLRVLKVKKQGIPGGMFDDPFTDLTPEMEAAAVEKWRGVLNEMIAGFEAAKRIIDYDEWKDDRRLVNRALRLLAKHYFDLWD